MYRVNKCSIWWTGSNNPNFNLILTIVSTLFIYLFIYRETTSFGGDKLITSTFFLLRHASDFYFITGGDGGKTRENGFGEVNELRKNFMSRCSPKMGQCSCFIVMASGHCKFRGLSFYYYYYYFLFYSLLHALL